MSGPAPTCDRCGKPTDEFGLCAPCDLELTAEVAARKATPAGAARIRSEGPEGATPAGSPLTVEGQDNTPPGGGERRGELPENRGLPSEATACGICGQEMPS